MTTRKRAGMLAAAAGALLVGGCATSGPLHVYSVAPTGERTVHDAGDGRTAEVPSFLEADETLIGFAYDPFTDHFFLRLGDGTRIRVVDRPARAIKREFAIELGAAAAAADLAVRPRDGHVFLLAGGPRILETSRLGKTIRTLTLTGAPDSPTGLALDVTHDRLLVLGADGRTVSVHDLQGARQNSFALERAAGASLAFDAEKRELYAPLRDARGTIGVFGETGKLLRTDAATGDFVDLGPRSFVRVF